MDQDSTMVERSVKNSDYFDAAELLIVDKKVGKSTTPIIPIKQPLTIENKYVVRVAACWMETIKKYRPEAKALIEVYKINQKNELDKSFQGWLFSKSPSLHYFNHERLDFFLVKCLN